VKVAVVVPFSTEPAAWLSLCFRSVLAQTHAAEVIAVGDGVTLSEEVPRPVRLIELPAAHGDGGRAARAIGAVDAITSGFDAVAFLDGDNWFAPSHIAEMVELHEKTGAPICTSSLTTVRVDGTPFAVPDDSDGEKHADTSTLFVTREAFPILPSWALVPHELGPICDRIWWHFAKASGYRRAHSPSRTVFYRNRYAQQYRLIGEAPPAGCKELPRLDPGRYSVRVPAHGMDCEIGK
jgi:glycosyltransferase involved in cell wall biosynthesis